MSDPPTPLSMERGGKGKTAIPEEEKAEEPSILPMTPESKQLAAVIATAVATAMAGRSAPPDSSGLPAKTRWRWSFMGYERRGARPTERYARERSKGEPQSRLPALHRHPIN